MRVGSNGDRPLTPQKTLGLQERLELVHRVEIGGLIPRYNGQGHGNGDRIHDNGAFGGDAVGHGG